MSQSPATQLAEAADALEPKFGPGTIETFSGEAYSFHDPDPGVIKLEDIGHALSNMCRFAGHTNTFYSVAEHSVLVSRILEAEGATEGWQLVGLMHDAHEAYVWDAPRPIKPLLGPEFKELAAKADVAIARAFHFDGWPSLFHSDTIKAADNIALCAERRALMTTPPALWERGYEDVPDPPENINWPRWHRRLAGGVQQQIRLGMLPHHARSVFLLRAKELGL